MKLLGNHIPASIFDLIDAFDVLTDVCCYKLRFKTHAL